MRLTPAALVVNDDFDWSDEPLTEDIFGTVSAINWRGDVFIESDDASRRCMPYAITDLEPIVDGDPAAAQACMRALHARQHVMTAASAAAADLDDSDEFFDAHADAGLGLHDASGAPAFTFGGIRK